MADQRILRNRAATLTLTRYDQDGIAADASGAVTVGVTRADGLVVKAAGTATVHGLTGIYTVTLTAAEVGANVGQLTATWTDSGGVSTTVVDVVGAYMVSVNEIRALPNLSDTAKFANAELIAARRWFEDLAERHCNVAFVPRFRRVRVNGTGVSQLLPPDPMPIGLLSARTYTDATTYTAFDATDLADVLPAEGYLTRSTRGVWTAGVENLVIEYEHGYQSPPSDIKAQALVAIRAQLLNDQVGRPMVSIADGAGGTTRYSMAGPDKPTGIDTVDEALNANRFLVLA